MLKREPGGCGGGQVAGEASGPTGGTDALAGTFPALHAAHHLQRRPRAQPLFLHHQRYAPCLFARNLTVAALVQPAVVLRACCAVVRVVRVVLLCVRRWCRSELRGSGVVQVPHVHARRRQPGLLPGMRQRWVFWTTKIFSFLIINYCLLIVLTFLWFCAQCAIPGTTSCRREQATSTGTHYSRTTRTHARTHTHTTRTQHTTRARNTHTHHRTRNLLLECCSDWPHAHTLVTVATEPSARRVKPRGPLRR